MNLISLWVYVVPETPEQLQQLLEEQVQRNTSLNSLWISAGTGISRIIRDSVEGMGTVVFIPTMFTVDPIFLNKYFEKYGEDFDVSDVYLLYGSDSMDTIAEILREYWYLGLTGSIAFDKDLQRFPMYEIYSTDYGFWGKIQTSYLLYTKRWQIDR